jgi:competence protein ComEA
VKLERTGWLAVLLLAATGGGIFAALRWPDDAAALPCRPDQVRWFDAGTAMVARCAADGGGGPIPAGASLTLGGKLDLNTATETELGLIPGVGPSLAHELVEVRKRLGGFTSWDQVDAVRGVGPARLDSLRGATRLPVSANDERP